MFRPLSPAELRLPTHFARIVIGLGRALYQHLRTDRAIPLVCNRLLKMAWDFQKLFDLWGMGQLPAARKRPEQKPRPKPVSARPKPLRPRSVLPFKCAWLVNILPDVTAYRALLQDLLAQPTIATFLVEAPEARRLLRRLWRLLGVQHSQQIPQPQNPNPSAHPPETAPPETARPKTASPETTPFDIATHERPTAPMAPDREQAAEPNTCATPPQILPQAA